MLLYEYQNSPSLPFLQWWYGWEAFSRVVQEVKVMNSALTPSQNSPPPQVSAHFTLEKPSVLLPVWGGVGNPLWEGEVQSSEFWVA